MTWACIPSTCLPAREGESSPTPCLDTLQSALSNSKSIPVEFFSSDNLTAFYLSFRFGTTLDRFAPTTPKRPTSSTEQGRLIRNSPYAAGSHNYARTSAQPEAARASTASAQDSGLSLLGSLARYDHDLRSWKTPQCSLFEDLAECSVTWPRWGTMRDGVCWERRTPSGILAIRQRITSAKESGSSLPTPCTVDSGSLFNRSASSGAALWPTPTRNDALGAGYQRANGKHYFTLPGAVGGTKHLPAAMESLRVERWPTPPAQNAVVGGALSPEWVELLMGWYANWTCAEPMKIKIESLTQSEPWGEGWEDGVPRVATGVKHRVDRLKCLGNGQVPACAALAWRTLIT